MADFMQAVKWMKEGKKVRRKIWTTMGRCKDEGRYTYTSSEYNRFRNQKGDEITISYEQVFAGDWEIYEEEDDWNLADKKKTTINGTVCEWNTKDFPLKCRSVLLDYDVKKFIEKVKEDINKSNIPYDCTSYLTEILDKRMGDL